jgi:hypothetical protein
MWVVVAIVCAIICGIIADKNSRSVGLAVFLGAMFGVFSVIGYLIAGSGAICPICKESVKPGAKICKSCGSELYE